MFYFKFNINDFIAATRHFTHIEIGILIAWILHYYQTEKPIHSDDFSKLFRKLCIQEENRAIAKELLAEFCVLKDGAYHWERIDQDIADYQKGIEYKSIAGKKSGEIRSKRKIEESKSKNSCSTSVGNQESRIKNQEPIINNQESLIINHERVLDTRSSEKSTNANLELTELIDLWNPSIEEVNNYLRQANLRELNEKDFRSNQLKFLTHYYPRINKLSELQLMGKFVKWIETQDMWSAETKSKNTVNKQGWDENIILEKVKEGE